MAMERQTGQCLSLGHQEIARGTAAGERKQGGREAQAGSGSDNLATVNVKPWVSLAVAIEMIGVCAGRLLDVVEGGLDSRLARVFREPLTPQGKGFSEYSANEKQMTKSGRRSKRR